LPDILEWGLRLRRSVEERRLVEEPPSVLPSVLVEQLREPSEHLELEEETEDIQAAARAREIPEQAKRPLTA